MRATEGILNLLASKKATLCILIFITTAILTFLQRMTGMELAAIVTTLGTIYMHTTQKTEIAAMNRTPPDQREAGER